MIIKGGARAAAGNLAAHLERVDTNEKVSIAGIEGLAATTIKEALHEIDALSTGTQCTRSMYHASLSPQPGEVEMTAEQQARAVEVLAEALGLTGQPHIVVQHIKTGESGITRTHQHVVWSRVNEDGKTLSDWNNYPAHERASRQIEQELGHEHTPGVFSRPDGVSRPERTPSAVEYQQAERSHINPKDAKALLSELWTQSDSGAAFIAAAADQGYAICRGDKRGFVVLDPADEIVTLSRRLPDTAAVIAARMPDRDTLPTVEEARAERELARATPAEGPEKPIEAIDPVNAREVAVETEAPSPARLDEQHEAISELEAGDPLPASFAIDAPFVSPMHEAEEPEHATPATGDSVDVQQSATLSYEGGETSGGDRFRDEPPTPEIAAPEPDIVGKSVGLAGEFVSRVVTKALEAAADLFDGLFSAFFGASTPPTHQKPQQVQQQAIPQRATPAEPVRTLPSPPQPKPQEPQHRPSASFLQAMTERLSAEDIARIERKAAEKAQIRDLPLEQRRDRGLER